MAKRKHATAKKTSPCPDCGGTEWREDEHSYGCVACDKVIGKSGSGGGEAPEEQPDDDFHRKT